MGVLNDGRRRVESIMIILASRFVSHESNDAGLSIYLRIYIISKYDTAIPDLFNSWKLLRKIGMRFTELTVVDMVYNAKSMQGQPVQRISQ